MSKKTEKDEPRYMGTGVESDLTLCAECGDDFEADEHPGRCRDCEEAATDWYTVRTR